MTFFCDHLVKDVGDDPGGDEYDGAVDLVWDGAEARVDLVVEDAADLGGLGVDGVDLTLVAAYLDGVYEHVAPLARVGGGADECYALGVEDGV